MFNIRSLGQQRQSDDIHYLKKKLKECYAAEGDTDRCAEIAKLLRSAIDRFNKEQGIQSPGGFLPQVSMQDPYSQSSLMRQQEAQIYQNLQAKGMTSDSMYSWNKGAAPMATQGARPTIPTMPFGSLFNQSMTASPLSMAPAAVSYGNYAGT